MNDRVMQIHQEKMRHSVDQWQRTFGVSKTGPEYNRLLTHIYDSAQARGKLSRSAQDAAFTIDIAGSVFFARQLELIEARLYRKKYAEFKARECFPVNNEGGPWTDSVTYRAVDLVGNPKIINASQSTDVPIIDVHASEFNQKTAILACAFEYSYFEIARAEKANFPLMDEKARATRDSIERGIDNIAWLGNEEYNIQGFLTNDLIPVANVVNGGGGDPEWNTKTPQEILFDILDAFASVQQVTKGVEIPDSLLLPVYQYNLLIQPRSDMSDTSIIKWIAENVPALEGQIKSIKSVPILQGQGVGGTDRMVVYKKDIEKLEYHIPTEYTVLPPVALDLGMKSATYAMTSGVIVRYPLSITFRDSI